MKTFAVTCLAIALALPAAQAQAASADQKAAVDYGPAEAAVFVETLGDQAGAILEEAGADETRREEELRALMDRGFGIESMSAHIVGDSWNSASAEQRAAFSQAFQKYLLARFVDFLHLSDPEDFRAVAHRSVGEASRITTEISRMGVTLTEVDWIVTTENGELQVVDVISNGVSLRETYRSEFQSFVNRKGMDALTTVLLRKVSN